MRKLKASEILYEDNHLIIVNKQASDIVQGDKTGDAPLSEVVKSWIKETYNKPGNVFTGVIHRLDRPVSGAVAFAKTSKGLSRMNELLRKKELNKRYWAIVENKPPKRSGKLVHFLKKNPKQNKSYAHPEGTDKALRSELNYKLLHSGDRYHLLEVELLTGRHHQIRAQLSAIGCTIKGDLKYGAARSNPDGSISLHARYLDFMHPIKKELVKVCAPVPEERLWKHFETALSS